MTKMTIKVREALNKDGLDIDALKKDVLSYVSSDKFQDRLDDVVIQLANDTVNKILKDAGEFDSNKHRPSEDSLVDTAFTAIGRAIIHYFNKGRYGT